MKKTLLLAAMIAAMPLCAMAQTTVEKPVVASKSIHTQGLFVQKVERAKKYTKIYFKYYHGWAEGWAQISSESYIIAGGKQLQQTKAEGIPLNEHFFGKGDNFESEFSLTFPPVDKSIETVDYIECSGPTCFRIYGIPLTQAASERNKAEIEKVEKEWDAKLNPADDGKHLEPAQLMLGNATIKGKIIGLEPEMLAGQPIEIVCYVNCPFISQEAYPATLKSDNTFEITIPLTSKNESVFFRLSPFVSDNVLLTSGETTEVIVDINRTGSAKPKPHGGAFGFYYYKGANADINNTYLQHDDLARIDYDKLRGFEGSSMEFKAKIYQMADENKKAIDQLSIPVKTKELMRIDLRTSMARYLASPSMTMKIDENTTFPMEYFNYVKDLDLNNKDILYSSDCQQTIMSNTSLTFAWVSNGRGYLAQDDLLKKMKEANMTDDTLDMVYDLLVTKKKDYPTLSDKEKEMVRSSYDRCTKIFNKALYGTTEGFIFDAKECQKYCSVLQEFMPISEANISKMEKMSEPTYAQFANMRNKTILAERAYDKARGGYYEHKAGETEADSILVEILKDHKGKVVLIDFWATTCGPCVSAIRQMAPRHKDFEDKGFDIVYVTDEDASPIDNYNRMMENVSGSKHRLSSNQFNLLKEKLHFSGIPSYTYINKHGMISRAGNFMGADYMLQIMDEIANE